MIINKKTYMRISLITGADYSGIKLNEKEYYIDTAEVKKMIKDLICEIGVLEEKIEDLVKED